MALPGPLRIDHSLRRRRRHDAHVVLLLPGGDRPPGSAPISHEQFLKDVWAAYEKDPALPADDTHAKARLKELDLQYAADKGQVVTVAAPGGAYLSSPYMWYANREAPAEEVKGLARLKGHLAKGQWVTKIRKVLRKDEMTDDLLLVPVDAGSEQEYVRLMPTSPP